MPEHRISKRDSRILATSGQTSDTIGITYDTATSKLVYCSTGTTCVVLVDDGGVSFDRLAKTVKVAVNGTSVQSTTVNVWTNTEATAVLVQRLMFDVTTVATSSTATVDIGVSNTTLTSVDNLIDGLSIASGVTADVFDNIKNGGTNGKASQRVGIGKFITITKATGDTTAAVGNIYITYVAV